MLFRSGNIKVARIIFSKAADMKSFREQSGLKERVNPAYWKLKNGEKTIEMIEMDEVSCLYLETFKKHEICDKLLAAFDKVGTKAGEKTAPAKDK